MVKQYLSDNSTDILHQSPSNVKWISYKKLNKLHVRYYCKVYRDKVRYVVFLKVISQEDTYTRSIMKKWLVYCVDLFKVRNKETNAYNVLQDSPTVYCTLWPGSED